jgi:hypothetical protein
VSPGRRTALISSACAAACACLGLSAPAALGKPGVEPDSSLGGDGTIATALPVTVTDAALDSQGRIVLGGIRFGQPSVARLLPDGSPDPTFGGDGESHEGSVNGTLDVDIDVLADGSVRALALVETGEDKYLRVDFNAIGTQTGAVRFDQAAGAASLTPQGGAVATRLDEQLDTRRYDFLGNEEPGFSPQGQPQSSCFPMAGCHYYTPGQLAVGPTGTVVQSVDSRHTNSPCFGSREILSLAPGAIDFETQEFVSGCGVNDVFSIAVAPNGQFLVSGWGAPPSKAVFIRLRRDGSLDESFGAEGVAQTSDLQVDNLFVSHPAIAAGGAFFNSITQPREPTLRLKPSRFSPAGKFNEKFASRSQQAEFTPKDGLSEFNPLATLRSKSKLITVIGTGIADDKPVVALARWRPR